VKKAFCILLLALILIIVALLWKKEPVDFQQEPEDSVPQRNINVPSFDEAVRQLPEIEGWKTTIDAKNGYVLLHPENFVVSEDAAVGSAGEIDTEDDGDEEEDGEEDIEDEENGQKTVQIQIRKQILSSDLKWFGDLKQHLLETENDLTQPVQEIQFGEYVVLSQYFSYGGSGEQYNIYFAYGPGEAEYFEIKILEPDFSENREAIEKMLETFTIFK
jgi:hypothetical protein